MNTVIIGTLPTGMSVTVSGSGNTRTLHISTDATFTAFGSVTILFFVSDTQGNGTTLSVSKTIADIAPIAGGAFASLGDMTIGDYY